MRLRDFLWAGVLLLSLLGGSRAWAGTESLLQDFRWLGVGTEDRLGSGSQTSADGVKDARFQVLLDLPGSTVIDELRVFVSDAVGNAGGEYWHSRNYGWVWVLGVYHQGKLLNPKPGASLGSFSGRNLFDLYANDSGRLASYSHFLLQVEVQGKVYARVIPSTPTVSPLSLSAPVPPKAAGGSEDLLDRTPRLPPLSPLVGLPEGVAGSWSGAEDGDPILALGDPGVLLRRGAFEFSLEILERGLDDGDVVLDLGVLAVSERAQEGYPTELLEAEREGVSRRIGESLRLRLQGPKEDQLRVWTSWGKQGGWGDSQHLFRTPGGRAP